MLKLCSYCDRLLKSLVIQHTSTPGEFCSDECLESEHQKKFIECPTCRAKPGSPTLCDTCQSRFTSRMRKQGSPAPNPNQISVRIAAVCSVPRLGWQDHFGSVFRALSPHNIALSWYTTAFWHKGIQQGFNKELSADWILSLDYDTVFDHIHVAQLLATFGNNPHMDALAAMQPRRGNGAPLMTAKDEQGKKLTKAPADGPIKAYTAHFGFTLFRTSALRDLPKPWFQGETDSENEWGDLCVDPDIYFWKKWAEHGKTLYVDPRIRVGHLEVMVSHMDEHMIQRYVPVSQWRAMHSDEGAQALEATETKG